MYILKVCHCCDAIVGELDMDDQAKIAGMEHSLDFVGNVAYTICAQCMQELDIDRPANYH